MPLDADTLRRVLRDFFRFNPKDFSVQGSGTGFLVSALRRVSLPPAPKEIKYGFEYFLAPPQDGVDPAAPGRFIQLYKGVINENVVPDNMVSVFELPNDTDSYLQCTTTQTSLGTVTSATLSVSTDAAPTDPEGSLGVAPATSSRDLWSFTVANDKIVLATAQRIGGIDVKRQVVDVSCGEVTLQMAWSPALNITVLLDSDA